MVQAENSCSVVYLCVSAVSLPRQYLSLVSARLVWFVCCGWMLCTLRALVCLCMCFNVLTAEIGWVLVLREKPGCWGWIFPGAGSDAFSIKALPESHLICHLDPSALQVVYLQVTMVVFFFLPSLLLFRHFSSNYFKYNFNVDHPKAIVFYCSITHFY